MAPLTPYQHPGAQDHRLVEKHLLNYLGLNTQELVELHPARFRDGNKRLVYDLMCPKGPNSHHGTLQYTRWRQFPLQEMIVPITKGNTTVIDGPFTYSPPPPNEEESHWHVNFSDSHVFGYYGGRVFSQDEMQCLEHPALCSLRRKLREHLVLGPTANDTPDNSTHTTTHFSETSIATPMLVSGVERRGHVRTDHNATEGRPEGLYGSSFGRATGDAVCTATEVFDTRLDANGKEYLSNILSVAVPRVFGTYNKETIRTILATAYTGFMAVRMEALVNAGFFIRHRDGGSRHTSLADPMPNREVPKMKIHSGAWSCGAYGRNPVIMSMLQIVAAQMADVEFIYYVRGAADKVNYDSGMKDLKDLMRKLTVDGHVILEALIDEISKTEYLSGMSNGS